MAEINASMVVTEGISGVWHYHLSPKVCQLTALCGARVMSTSLPLTSWGTRGHLNEKWCEKCRALGSGETS